MRNATFMSVFLWFSSNSLASVDICQPVKDFSHLSVAFYSQDQATIDGSTSQIDQRNNDADLQYKMNESWAFGVGHRYVVLGVEPVDLQTNGHLHTLFFPVHRQTGSGKESFRLSIAPALSASSNVIKNPGEYSSDTLQLLFAMVWSRALSERVQLRYGVCGDHRFGSYEVYPLISFGWQPRTGLLVELGFPTSRLTYQAKPNVDLSLRVAPHGNEWHAKSRDLQQQSQLVFESSLVELTVNWQARDRLAIAASVGQLFDNRYDVTLLDGSRARLSHGAVTRVGAALQWRF